MLASYGYIGFLAAGWPATTRSRSHRSPSLLLGRDRRRRRQPADRLRPAGARSTSSWRSCCSPSSAAGRRPPEERGRRLMLLEAVLDRRRRAAARRSSTPPSARPSPSAPGVINLGTEGSMLVGALAAYAVGIETGNPWVGVARRRARRRAAGRWSTPSSCCTAAPTSSPPASSCMFLGLGLTVAVRRRTTSARASNAVRPLGRSRACRDIPFSAPILFDHDPLTYLSFVAGAGAVVGAVPHRVGPAAAGRRRAARGARRLRHLGRARPVPRRRSSAAALAGIGGAQLSTASRRTGSRT